MSFQVRASARTLLAALAFGIAACSAAVWTLGGALCRPATARLGDPPAELGATVVRLPLSGSRVAVGWFARGVRGSGALLLLHPLRGNRSSMLDRALFLRRAGYTLLLLDLPAHGESSGDRISFGAHESDAAHAAIAYLRAAAPEERIGALGVSLGGASLLLGEREPAANEADAVVLEAVYPTIGEAVADRLRMRLGALGPPLTPLLTLQLRPRLGVGAESLRPIDRVSKLHVPVLVIAGEADRHTTLAESRRLFAALREPKELWVVPGAVHGNFHALDSAEYEHHLLAFFQRYLREPAAQR